MTSQALEQSNKLPLEGQTPILAWMTPDCDICKVSNEQTANLLDTRYWAVNMAHDQGYLGRAYITLREHTGSLSELSEAAWKDYIDIVRRLEYAYKKGLGATLFNWTCLMNHAYRQKPYEPHVHWHLRPRYEESVTINGIVFGDPKFGSHYDRNQHRQLDDETFQTILERVKKHL